MEEIIHDQNGIIQCVITFSNIVCKELLIKLFIRGIYSLRDVIRIEHMSNQVVGIEIETCQILLRCQILN